MKLPTHISILAKSVTTEYDGKLLNCEIVCPCGNKIFQILFPGEAHLYQGKKIPCTMQIEDKFFFLIRARCIKCGMEHLLFDKDFHGWDGCVCNIEKEATLPRPPLIVWQCTECSQDRHLVRVEFCYGSEDGIQEAIDDGTIDNPADAFEWIYIDIKCENCGLETEKWVDYETA